MELLGSRFALCLNRTMEMIGSPSVVHSESQIGFFGIRLRLLWNPSAIVFFEFIFGWF